MFIYLFIYLFIVCIASVILRVKYEVQWEAMIVRECLILCQMRAEDGDKHRSQQSPLSQTLAFKPGTTTSLTCLLSNNILGAYIA